MAMETVLLFAINNSGKNSLNISHLHQRKQTATRPSQESDPADQHRRFGDALIRYSPCWSLFLSAQVVHRCGVGLIVCRFTETDLLVRSFVGDRNAFSDWKNAERRLVSPAWTTVKDRWARPAIWGWPFFCAAQRDGRCSKSFMLRRLKKPEADGEQCMFPYALQTSDRKRNIDLCVSSCRTSLWRS